MDHARDGDSVNRFEAEMKRSNKEFVARYFSQQEQRISPSTFDPGLAGGSARSPSRPKCAVYANLARSRHPLYGVSAKLASKGGGGMFGLRIALAALFVAVGPVAATAQRYVPPAMAPPTIAPPFFSPVTPDISPPTRGITIAPPPTLMVPPRLEPESPRTVECEPNENYGKPGHHGEPKQYCHWRR